VSAELIREASRNDARVARLRCYDSDGVTLVEAVIFPVGGGAPVSRGPYRFTSAHEAFRFVQEAMQALQYLGCAVS
jgi:hypothetical protein